MNFDLLAEHIISTIEEGRPQKTEKYSSIVVDGEKLKQMLESGDLDSAIESLSNNPRYANLAPEKIKEILTNISNEIEEYQPTSFDELKSTFESAIYNAYAHMGPRRKTFVDRLTRSLGNVVLKADGVVSKGEETTKASSREENILDTELTEIESSLFDYIRNADSETTTEEAIRYVTGNFQLEEEDAVDTINSLINKGVLTNEDGILVPKEETTSSTAIEDEDIENDDEDSFANYSRGAEDAFKHAPEVERNYRSTRSGDEDFFDSNL
jgi:hypothetical protein